MKAVICDGCHRTSPTIGDPPEGWLLIRRYYDALQDEDREYCSTACAVIALNDRLMKQQRPLLKAEA